MILKTEKYPFDGLSRNAILVRLNLVAKDFNSWTNHTLDRTIRFIGRLLGTLDLNRNKHRPLWFGIPGYD